MINAKNLVSLDVVDGDWAKFEVWKETPYNLVNQCFYPKQDARIGKVTSMDQVLWQASGASSCAKVIVSYHNKSPVLLYLAVANKGSPDPQYFEFAGQDAGPGMWFPVSDHWDPVSQDQFYAVVHRLVESYKVLTEVELSLGTKVDPKKIVATQSSVLFVDVFVPNVGFKLTSVRDKFCQVWKSESPSQRCVTVFGYPRMRYSFLHLVVEDASGEAPAHTDLYFSRSFYQWKRVSKQEFFNSFELEFGQTGLNGLSCSLDEDLYCYYYKNVQLRPDDIDKDVFKVDKRHLENLTNVAVTPKPGFFLKEVYLDRLLLLCSASETVLYANLHFYHNQLFSFYLLLSANGSQSVIYFLRRDSEWSVVNFAQYLAAFSNLSLDKPESTRSDSLSTKVSTRAASVSLKRGNSFGARRNGILKTVSMAELLKKNGFSEEPFHGKIFTSSFRNVNNLLIRTYFSPAENYSNPRRVHRMTEKDLGGDRNAILVSGIAASFMNMFLTPNITKFSARHPYVNMNPYHTGSQASVANGKRAKSQAPSGHHSQYSEIFHNSDYYGDNLLDLFKMYRYEGSVVELLNKLGYNVYGFDLQSHGLSEGADDLKCYVTNYHDYISDLTQFISIVREGKFFDHTQSYTRCVDAAPATAPPSPPVTPSRSGRKAEPKPELMLVGHSMGANICLQAIEWHNVYDLDESLVDRFVSVSGMYNVLDLLGPVSKTVLPLLSKAAAAVVPKESATFLSFRNFGSTLRLYKRFHDPYVYFNKHRNSKTSQIFEACVDALRNVHMYPSNLRTLILHANKDPMCHINGSNKLYEHLKDCDSEYVPVNCDFHSVLDYEYTGLLHDVLG